MPNARAGFYVEAARIAAIYELPDEMESWWRKAVSAGAGPEHAALLGVASLTEFAADPVLDVTQPVEGAIVRASSVEVRGELTRGRRTDEVFVNGTFVRRGPGAFSTTVPTADAGLLTLEVWVEESGRRRGVPATRTVRYEPLPRGVQEFLAGWATAFGTETDDATGYPKRIQRTVDGARMVLVPARRSTEHPVGAFYLDETSVTVAQWRAFADRGGGTMPARLVGYGPQHPIPVARGSEEARAFAAWVGAALPTDAQWAWAVRGDATAEEGGASDTPAPLSASSGGGDFAYKLDAVPVAVRDRPPNGFGLYGMGVRASMSFRCASVRSLP